MNQPSQRIYLLDGVEIDAAQVCLRREGKEQHLRSRAFQVLLYLLEARDRVVTKNELIDRIWPDTSVTDNTLEQCLAEIRRVLGDNSRQPRFIKTIPRAGYRFIGAVEEINGKRAALDDRPPTATTLDKPQQTLAPQAGSNFSWRSILFASAALMIALVAIGTWYLKSLPSARPSLVTTTLTQDPTRRPVAVMFFDNESGSADLDWLREGLSDMIITELSRSNKLTVLSRQQLHVLLERAGHNPTEKVGLDEAINLGRQTQASVLVLGSFAKLGDQIRIDVHLHDAHDGQLLTAERLVVDQPAQILTQVDLLSAKLAAYIGGAETPVAYPGAPGVITNSLEAFRYYSLGVGKAQSLRNDEAVKLLQKAVALDPKFAMAYARLGYVHGVTGNAPDKAKPYLEKAFQLSDRLTEKDKLQIHAWYAIVNFDYAGAIDAFRKIVSAYPLEVEAYRRLGLLLKGEVRYQEALEVLKQALVIDAADKDLYNALCLTYSEMGDHEHAIAMAQRYVQLAPEEPNAHDSLGLTYEWAGRYDEAIHEYELALQLKSDFEIAMVHLGNVYFQQGRYRAAIEEYNRYLQVAPTDAERTRGYSAIGYVELKQGNLPAAEHAASQAMKYNPQGYGLPYLLALARNDLPKAAKLKEELEKTPANDRGIRPSLRPFYLCRGMLALRSNASDEAIEDFKLSIGHRPQIWNLDASEDCLAKAYLELKRFDEAIAEYHRIQKLNPNYPLLHYYLGQAYAGKGQPEQARAEYEQFLQIWKDADPDLPQVVTARKSLAG